MRRVARALLRSRGMLPELRLVVGEWQVVLSTHAALAGVAAAVGAILAMRRALPPSWMPALVAGALAGSHLFHRALNGGALDFRAGGLSSMGGMIAIAVMLAAMAWRTGVRIAVLADAVAPAGLLALGIGRLGCFLAGCCFGVPTALPWGVVFPALGPPARHPLQLYAAAVDVALALGLCGMSGPPGTVAGVAMAGLGAARLGLELGRDPSASDRAVAGLLSSAQAGACVLVLAGVATLVRARRGVRHRVALPGPDGGRQDGGRQDDGR